MNDIDAVIHILKQSQTTFLNQKKYTKYTDYLTDDIAFLNLHQQKDLNFYCKELEKRHRPIWPTSSFYYDTVIKPLKKKVEAYIQNKKTNQQIPQKKQASHQFNLTKKVSNQPKKTIKSPANYREIEFFIAGKHVLISGMARPDFSKPNSNMIANSVSESMAYLKEKKHDVIIGLHANSTYEKAAKEVGIQYISKKVKDFHPPSIQLCEEIYQLVNTCVTNGKKVGIHCGEGFGRTGTVLSAIKLKELIQLTPRDELVNETNSAVIHVGHYGGNKNIACTPMVKKAIDFIRVTHGSEHSVEMENQVAMLCQYQSYLLAQLKKEKYQPITTQSEPVKQGLISQQNLFKQKLSNLLKTQNTTGDPSHIKEDGKKSNPNITSIIETIRNKQSNQDAYQTTVNELALLSSQKREQTLNLLEHQINSSAYKTLRQDISLRLKKNLYYTQATLSTGRRHTFSTKNVTGYTHYTGDRLKTEILSDFKLQLNNAQTTEELKTIVDEFKQTKAYETLKQGQDLFTRITHRTTDSIKALNQLIKEAEHTLSQRNRNNP